MSRWSPCAWIRTPSFAATWRASTPCRRPTSHCSTKREPRAKRWWPSSSAVALRSSPAISRRPMPGSRPGSLAPKVTGSPTFSSATRPPSASSATAGRGRKTRPTSTSATRGTTRSSRWASASRTEPRRRAHELFGSHWPWHRRSCQKWAMTELRNAAIVAELDRAVARQTYADLFVLLRRFSGLPGPRANEKLAWAAARSIAAFGSKADGLVAAMCAAGTGRTLETGTIEFLPMVGAFTLASRYPTEKAETVLAGLRPMSEDPRHAVRESVVAALAEMGRAGGEPFVLQFASWTDGYLSASVALSVATSRPWLDALRTPDAIVLRMDEAFALIESAPRADQRSQ